MISLQDANEWIKSLDYYKYQNVSISKLRFYEKSNGERYFVFIENQPETVSETFNRYCNKYNINNEEFNNILIVIPDSMNSNHMCLVCSF